MEHTHMPTEQNMRETGRTICRTDMESKLGKMEADTKDFIKKE